MDRRALERRREAFHGMVTRRGRPWGVALVALVALALLSGLAGGLVRAGVALPVPEGTAWLSRAVLLHAALMIGSFLGTVIGIERAVAVRHRAAWLAPVSSASAGLAMLLGLDAPGAWLLLASSMAFMTVNALVVSRQSAAHTYLLLAGAVCWAVGNLLFALEWSAQAVVPWWFAFLVMTIAAERLEMTRLMRRRPGARPALIVLLAALATGAALTAVAPQAGGVLYGAALLLLALWLLFFDIARRTVAADGLPRYMALCLLGGYLWLAVAGIAWAAVALGLPARDTALHALGLGFVVSMMMGHAPVILPAVARVKVLFGAWFYVPLAVLHVSLLVRLAGGWADAALRTQGAAMNAGAIALFAATVAAAALAWRRRYRDEAQRE
jgi:hypothetical protein